MEELFRFVALRAPEAIEPEESEAGRIESVSVSEDTSLEEVLEDRETIDKPEQGNMLLMDLTDRVVASADEEIPPSPHDLIQQVMGSSASDIVSSGDWSDFKEKLEAGILKAKYFSPDPAPDLYALYQQRAGISLIEAAAADAGLSTERARRLARQTLLLPAFKKVRKGEDQVEPPQDEHIDQETFVAQLGERFTKMKKLKDASEALLKVSNSDIKADKLNDIPGTPGTTSTRSTISSGTGVFRRMYIRLFGVADDPSDSANFIARSTPVVNVTDRGYERLPDEVKTTLTSLQVDPREDSIEEIHTLLNGSQLKTREDLRVTMKPLLARTRTTSGPLMMMAGNTAMAESSLSKSIMKMAMKGGYYLSPSFFFPHVGMREYLFCIPSRLSPSGVGQLLVVRQQLLGYKKGEISHVENVLAGEIRVREHARSITTETIFETEIETERTEERDLETTDRFQLSSETSNTVKEELEVKGEVKVSARFGPSVKMDASAGVAWKQSKENSSKRSVQYSKEITEKSVNKLVEKVRELRRRRIVEEVSEKNTHSFNNSGGEGPPPTDHIQGIYQWLDKVYQAQVYDYGLRTFYDLVIPEPAAFYIAAFQSENATATPHLKKPEEFLVDPLDITEINYGDWVAEYGATDVLPPPEPYLTLAKTFTHERVGDWKKNRMSKEGTLEIRDGYEAFTGWSTVSFTGKSGEGTLVDLAIGRSGVRHSFDGPWTITHYLGNETGSIPISLMGYKTEVLAVAIEVNCRRTERALDEWRLDTHEKLQTAYEKRLADYNAELDKLSMLVEAQIRGGNPAANRKRAATEVKKACISLISNQRLLMDSINVDADDIPYVDIPMARENDPLIRFLEQAFEWENMSFFYYPYFWGRKEPHWKQKILFDDADPEFADFIRAGAARVQLSVRPGFEEAVDHYTKTCEPWDGGELPTITDDLYLPFVEEHKAQLGAPGDEVPVEEPWEVVVPTSLVYLKDSAELPHWEEVDGEWVDVSE
ncbi:MAG: hypothetical protein QNK19_07175 [Xanthomonadales bacterium]|nr:hypothetical protein [Xanthomonadales bacterium]